MNESLAALEWYNGYVGVLQHCGVEKSRKTKMSASENTENSNTESTQSKQVQGCTLLDCTCTGTLQAFLDYTGHVGVGILDTLSRSAQKSQVLEC